MTDAELTRAAWQFGACHPRHTPHEEEAVDFLSGPEALGKVASLEATLTDEQLQKYDRWLSWVIIREDKDEYWTPMRRACTYAWHATPRQRLLALLHVLKPELFQ